MPQYSDIAPRLRDLAISSEIAKLRRQRPLSPNVDKDPATGVGVTDAVSPYAAAQEARLGGQRQAAYHESVAQEQALHALRNMREQMQAGVTQDRITPPYPGMEKAPGGFLDRQRMQLASADIESALGGGPPPKMATGDLPFMAPEQPPAPPSGTQGPFGTFGQTPVGPFGAFPGDQRSREADEIERANKAAREGLRKAR